MFGHPHHIPQPPHSAGKPFSGLRARIDPEQIPSPIEAQEADEELWSENVYPTLPGTHVPLSTTEYVALDQGNSTPRFIRLTTWNVPSTSDLASTCQIPLGALVQPLADTHPNEEGVPFIPLNPASDDDDEVEEGPLRCEGCRAYVNPWCTWTSGGSRWRCNLCAHESEVPPSQYAPINAPSLVPLNPHTQLPRPELTKGTCTFAVPSSYHASYPAPRILPSYVSIPSSPLPSSPLPSSLSKAKATTTHNATTNTTTSPLSASFSKMTFDTKSSHVPQSTDKRPPTPMHTIFAIDVSAPSVVNGYTRAVCEAVKGVVFGSSRHPTDGAGGGDEGLVEEGEDPCLPSVCKTAIVTFDSTVHFYNLSPRLPQATMHVVPDILEMFCPLRDAMFVSPSESRNVIESLLDALPSRFTNTNITGCATGPAVQGCLAALAPFGGHIVVFTASPPSLGPGSSSPSFSSSSSSRTTSFLSPSSTASFNTSSSASTGTGGGGGTGTLSAQDAFWLDLGDECAESGVGVSVFAASGSGLGVELGSMAPLATLTGGALSYFPRFDDTRDSDYVRSQLRGTFKQIRGYDASIIMRCSTGLRVRASHGLFTPSPSSPSLSTGLLTSSSTYAFSLTHSTSLSSTLSSFAGPTLSEREYAYFQCAVLYTSVDGMRKVRVVNVGAVVSGLAGNVFRYADCDAVVTFFAKEAISTASIPKLENIREDLTERCAAILLAYRRNCAAATSPSQLILPEAFKLLPLYVLALQKSKPLKDHSVTPDTRAYYSHRLLNMPVRTTLQYLYPRLLALHDLTDDIAIPNSVVSAVPPRPTSTTSISDSESTSVFAQERHMSQLKLPALMRNSHLLMEGYGVYLIDNEETMVLWVGTSVSPALLKDLMDCDNLLQLDTLNPHIPNLPTLISKQVHTVLASRKALRGGSPPPKFMIARQNLDASEIEFSDMLVEDTNNGAMSYLDYLCFVHKQINVALTSGTSIGNGGSGFGLRGTPW
ncbi:hypothetical protein BD410DRAFT_797254 [Rickenella mellea]|uniref:Sec24-like protein n=1 Tax=Rickenella mellea TaxID=50990 RepID=A0A4Y7PFZ3_9AGAM|nr:hypothetical protein BD410DRAFT_797254 [Rickenella mellea]